MVKDFKRWTTQLAATVLYNGRGAANLLGADMTWKNVCLPGVNCGYCRYAEAGCPWWLTQHTLTGLLYLWAGGFGGCSSCALCFWDG